MHGNILLAVLTLVVAMILLVPALLAGWSSEKRAGGKQGKDGLGPRAVRPPKMAAARRNGDRA